MRLAPWRYFLHSILFLSAVLVAGGCILQERLQLSLRELLEEENLRAARLASRLLSARDELQAQVREIAELSDARVTVIAADGRVLADSSARPAEMESHALRPELQAAAALGWGHDFRISATMAIPMIYTAVRLGGDGGGAGGYVRLARSLQRMNEITGSITRRIWLAIPVVILLAGLSSYLLIELRMVRDIEGDDGRGSGD